MTTPPSQEDIAQALGLNKSTVSRALRNDSRINAETAQLVRDKAQAMGYQRNPLFVAMSEIGQRKAGHRSLMNWAFIMTELAHSVEENRIMAELLKRYSRDAGYDLTEIVMPPAMTTQQLTRTLRARNVRGLLINHIYRSDLVKKIDFKALDNAVDASVYCGNFFFEPIGFRVVENEFSKTMLALAKMLELGFQRIALLYAEPLKFTREVVRQRAAIHVFNEDHPELMLFNHAIPENHSANDFPGADALLISHTVQLNRIPGPIQKLPYAILRAHPLSNNSGICRLHENMASTAVDMLDMQLRCRAIGAKSNAHTILVEGQWQDGETLKPHSRQR